MSISGIGHESSSVAFFRTQTARTSQKYTFPTMQDQAGRTNAGAGRQASDQAGVTATTGKKNLADFSRDTYTTLIEAQSGSEYTTNRSSAVASDLQPVNNELLDNTFTSDETPAGDLLDQPLLLPNAETIAALSQHASDRLVKMLQDYGIGEAPKHVSYSDTGELELPDDYPHAEALEAAFAENPGLSKELQATYAISSHLAAIQQSAPFREEYAGASSPAQAREVVAKYAHLFQPGRDYPDIELKFSKGGTLTVQADGRNLV